jgi:methyl-accepting chemotaxis protein
MRGKNLTFGAKIITLLVLTVLVVSGAITGMSYYVLNKYFNSRAQKDINGLARVVESYKEELKAKCLSAAGVLATDDTVSAAVAAKDTAKLQKLAKEFMDLAGIEVVTIADAEGVVIARGHSDKVGDSVLKQHNVKNALAGNPSVGIEEGSVVKFSARAGYPVKAGGAVVGSVTAGIDLTHGDRFVDQMKKLLDVECTIFELDTRVSTTIMREGKRAVGTKMDNPKVIETVLQKGQEFHSVNTILGKEYTTAYWPIRNPENKISGMLFIGKDRDDISQAYAEIFTTIVVSVLVIAVLVLAAGLLAVRSMNRPLQAVMAFAGEVAAGNLDAAAKGVFSGEMAALKERIENMVAKLKQKIAESDAKTGEAAAEAEKARTAQAQAEDAVRLAESAKLDGMLAAAQKLEGIVGRITATSEALSAEVDEMSRGSELQKDRIGETVRAMEQMNATILDVARSASDAAKNVDTAKQKAQTGAKVVDQSVHAISKVNEVSTLLEENMHQLGEQVKSIDQVINVINDIADQTNLLALNAAIEAARAGDAGRGFAVVADEVRKLAEKTMGATKEVADNILAIQASTRKNIESMDMAGKTITEATKLASESGEALKEIVALSETNAGQVQSIAAASEEQSAASEEINRAVEEVNRVATETADVMSQSAKAISDLAQMAGELRSLVQDLKTQKS